MSSADVTQYALTLGAEDSTTGWYACEYASGTIKMVLRPKGSSFNIMGVGYHSRYDLTGFTASVVNVGDVIKDSNNTYYTVNAVQEEWWNDTFSHYVCDLVKRDFSAQPTTSGTWHLDSDSIKTDPRERMKTWLETYLVAGSMELDDALSNADTQVVFSNPPYHIGAVLLPTGKDVDAVFAVQKSVVEPLYTYNHRPYGFRETVPVTVYACNKTGLTATNLLEQAEQELRRCADDYPVTTGLGSIREIASITHTPIDLGSTFMYSTTVNFQYVRGNDDYNPSTPTYSDNIEFTYEGDRTNGGTEGTWTLTDSGNTSQSVDSENNLDLYCTAYVDDSYTTSGTDLGISTTIYGKIRFRYKTIDSAKARIWLNFSDATGQFLMDATASTTWTVVEATIHTGKTLDHIRLYCSTGAGHVYYDYVQVYTGSYIIPVVTRLDQPTLVNDALLEVPSRIGSLAQPLGMESMEITMECDLDVFPSGCRWRRVQDGSSETDYNNTDALYETLHYGASNIQAPWVWLDLGEPAMQFKARLVEIRPSLQGGGNRIELRWREYRHGSAATETPTERWGYSL